MRSNPKDRQTNPISACQTRQRRSGRKPKKRKRFENCETVHSKKHTQSDKEETDEGENFLIVIEETSGNKTENFIFLVEEKPLERKSSSNRKRHNVTSSRKILGENKRNQIRETPTKVEDKITDQVNIYPYYKTSKFIHAV